MIARNLPIYIVVVLRNLWTLTLYLPDKHALDNSLIHQTINCDPIDTSNSRISSRICSKVVAYAMFTEINVGVSSFYVFLFLIELKKNVWAFQNFWTLKWPLTQMCESVSWQPKVVPKSMSKYSSVSTKFVWSVPFKSSDNEACNN